MLGRVVERLDGGLCEALDDGRETEREELGREELGADNPELVVLEGII